HGPLRMRSQKLPTSSEEMRKMFEAWALHNNLVKEPTAKEMEEKWNAERKRKHQLFRSEG
ncbi:Hypothetical protein FKW44_008888, partial [Caligus rogercresseyi]